MSSQSKRLNGGRQSAVPGPSLLYGAGLLLGGIGLAAGGRVLLEKISDRLVSILTQDPYQENMLEAKSEFRRVGVQELLEIDLRASDYHILRRPLGSPRPFPNFHALLFNFAQLDPLPTDYQQPVNTKVTIGPAAERPLEIDLPILIAGMGYGVALTKAAKIAIAQAANTAGTATNTGEGPFLPEEREVARKLIVQYHRGNWLRMEAIEQADAVEVHIGQGASGSVGSIMPPEKVTPELKREMGFAPGEEATSQSTFDELARGEGLKPIVDRARRLSRGAPVTVKLAASHLIERDLDRCKAADVDGVVLDGAQAGTGQSPPIAQDDFGIPTLYALVRARAHLDRIDPEGRITLIVAGGLYTPGDFLKCLALGADAVYVGTAIILSLMAGQQQKATPTEPPSQVIMYQGNKRRKFSVRKGSTSVANFLRAAKAEIALGVRLLGKDDIRDLSPSDLSALDDETAKVTGVPVAYKAPVAHEVPQRV